MSRTTNQRKRECERATKNVLRQRFAVDTETNINFYINFLFLFHFSFILSTRYFRCIFFRNFVCFPSFSKTSTDLCVLSLLKRFYVGFFFILFLFLLKFRIEFSLQRGKDGWTRVTRYVIYKIFLHTGSVDSKKIKLQHRMDGRWRCAVKRRFAAALAAFRVIGSIHASSNRSLLHKRCLTACRLVVDVTCNSGTPRR